MLPFARARCPRLWPRTAGPKAVESLDQTALVPIRELAATLSHVSDQDLAGIAEELRQTVRGTRESSMEAATIPGFALMTTAIERVLSVRLYDTQLLAGLILSRGMIAEMETGEGKTLAAAAPTFVWSLAGQGVHVMTTNQYLAERDSELLAPVHRLLGASVAVLRPNDRDRQRRESYHCDITYGPGYVFGFDYLRDQIVRRASASRGAVREFLENLSHDRSQGIVRQRSLAYAVIDEVDSVLLDEATTPLLISGSRNTHEFDPRPFRLAQELAAALKEGEHYVHQAAANRPLLTPSGVERSMHAAVALRTARLDRPWLEFVEHALMAETVLERDVHYVVANDQVQIVDESTGRIHPDRTWREGLHQAVEAKEGVSFTPPGTTMVRVTRQKLARCYPKLCGMTGTTRDAEGELLDTYNLAVVRIPTLRPSLRAQMPDRFFTAKEAKWRAAVQDIARLHQTGRPVLVGSRTIRTSESIARLLGHAGMPCRVLNGKQTADEAALVAQAGERGAVTVATNMAGRGTDIRLGAGVAALGGLHMLGLERHTSSRIDAQLAGRVARQGDPGSFQFFVSADDALLRFAASKLSQRMREMPNHNGEIAADQSKEVRRVQVRAEIHAANQRRELLDRDAWLGETTALLYGAV